MAEGNKPRGRMSAYAFFLKTSHEEHETMHPTEDVGFADFARECFKRWEGMSHSEKERFHLMAAEDKYRYEREMSTHVCEGGARVKVASKKLNVPKRPLAAFFHFCQEERPKVEADSTEATAAEVLEELGRRWQDCNQERKRKYEQMAAEDEARYRSEMAAYRKEGELDAQGHKSTSGKGSKE